MIDLFGQEIVEQPKTAGQPKGYSAPPGTGPVGQTCKTCRHCRRLHWNKRKNFYKCVLIAKRWTQSYGTDIRLRSPACRNWQSEDDEYLPLNQWDETED